MRHIALVTPVFRRFALTEIMLKHRKQTFIELEKLGVVGTCVVIGDDDNLITADGLGFPTIQSPNLLGAKYNDGHQWAVENHFDISFQVNSDQVFHPELLRRIAESPLDSLIRTVWSSFVHGSGKKSLIFQNPVWSMKAYPTDLLRKAPRPCSEDIMSMCDTSTHNGVVKVNPNAPTHTVELGPLESIQFESGFQITGWLNWVKLARYVGTQEVPVPWDEITRMHGHTLTDSMRRFYGT